MYIHDVVPFSFVTVTSSHVSLPGQCPYTAAFQIHSIPIDDAIQKFMCKNLSSRGS